MEEALAKLEEEKQKQEEEERERREDEEEERRRREAEKEEARRKAEDHPDVRQRLFVCLFGRPTTLRREMFNRVVINGSRLLLSYW